MYLIEPPLPRVRLTGRHARFLAKANNLAAVPWPFYLPHFSLLKSVSLLAASIVFARELNESKLDQPGFGLVLASGPISVRLYRI